MFTFKQFTVNDDQSSMKVGTDAVLIGALAQMPIQSPNKRILDIGTGCGVIALMLAQRFNDCNIDAVDIDLKSTLQAHDNFLQSPWGSKIHIYNTKIQNYTNTDYDLIVSNPPFFENSLKAPNSQRNLARHTDTLSIQDLIANVKRLLSSNGVFWGIFPYSTAQTAITEAQFNGLNCNHQIHIRNKENTAIKRTIFKLSYSAEQIDTQYRFIRNENNTYSTWYKTLTSPFYTHLK